MNIVDNIYYLYSYYYRFIMIVILKPQSQHRYWY